MDYFKLSLDDLIVLYDDMDTPLGQLRLRYKGSAGGHNGIKSIIQHIGTQEFKRIRIGISRPPEGIGVIDYVLQDFHKQEQEQIKQVLDDICDAVAMACVESFDKVMARYNGKK
jgi:PTH1 family peptidyl-tRNA hydrolase